MIIASTVRSVLVVAGIIIFALTWTHLLLRSHYAQFTKDWREWRGESVAERAGSRNQVHGSPQRHESRRRLRFIPAILFFVAGTLLLVSHHDLTPTRGG